MPGFDAFTRTFDDQPTLYDLTKAEGRFEHVGMPGLAKEDFHLKGTLLASLP